MSDFEIGGSPDRMYMSEPSQPGGGEIGDYPDTGPYRRPPSIVGEPATETPVAHEPPVATPLEAVDAPHEIQKEAPRQWPHNVFVGTEARRSGFKQWYTAQTEMRSQRPFVGETPLTREDKELISGVNKGMALVGDEVNVDVRSRLPQPEQLDRSRKYHFFDSEEQYITGIESRWGEGAAERMAAGTRGFSHPDTGIVWTRNADVHENAYGLSHETGHDLSVRHIAAAPPVPDASGGYEFRVAAVHSGYTDLIDPTIGAPRESHALTEAVTDMAAKKGMERAGYAPLTSPGYPEADILMGWVVLKTAVEHGTMPAEVENGLIRGLWSPDRSELRRVGDVFGEAGLKTIVNLKSHAGVAHMVDVARNLGLPEAADQLESWEFGLPTLFFSWRRQR